MICVFGSVGKLREHGRNLQKSDGHLMRVTRKEVGHPAHRGMALCKRADWRGPCTFVLRRWWNAGNVAGVTGEIYGAVSKKGSSSGNPPNTRAFVRRGFRYWWRPTFSARKGKITDGAVKKKSGRHGGGVPPVPRVAA
jgi:hypothetical protein